MYWFTKKKNLNKLAVLLFGGTVAYLTSCSTPVESNNSNKQVYFDIPAYFENQIAVLQSTDPLVEKTVSTNKETETKEVKISDWNIELSPFLDVDLNKSAYQDFITKDSTANKVTYQFNNDKLDLEKVVIFYDNNTPVEFEITKRTKNFLYETDELLKYTTQKIYNIQKNQKVILLGENDYQIIGEIK